MSTAPMKYLVVSGGVISGLGKGITISSIGALLKAAGVSVTAIKIDPYLNVDAGTMSPLEHGEVFVMDDGGETDLDLGNYERFLDVRLTRDHNITTGKVYSKVIEAERKGAYLGKTVQVIPHVTNAVMDWIERVACIPVDGTDRRPDVCLVEVGGTVGDMESVVFLEALRQLSHRVGRRNVCFAHVTLVPETAGGEQKTKPTQHAVRALRSAGINPDILICRSKRPINKESRAKLALHCQVEPSHLFTVADVSNIYHVPLLLNSQGAPAIIGEMLGIEVATEGRLGVWEYLSVAVDEIETEVTIAVVGKYTGLQDSYLSVIKALRHAAVAVKRKLKISWMEAENLEEDTMHKSPDRYEEAWKALRAADGVLVPGGFGDRGIEGKILAANYARTNKVPYLGVCLGMQLAVVEYARNVLGWDDANSSEFNASSTHPMVVMMSEIDPHYMGGTMRLGATRTVLYADKEGKPSLAHKLYGGADAVLERHRHRYEVNPHNVRALTDAGLVFSGTDEGGQRMETVELPSDIHPFYFAAQYHPEFLTRPSRPSPPFLGLLSAAAGQGVPEGPAVAAMEAFETLTAAGKFLPVFKLPTMPRRSPTGSPAGAGGGAGAGADEGGLERAMSMASIDEVAVKLDVMSATAPTQAGKPGASVGSAARSTAAAELESKETLQACT